MEALNLSLKPDPSLPLTYWNQLTQEDKIEFIKLRNAIHQNQKPSSIIKDRRLATFSNELVMILKYIEHNEVGREVRSILTGISFAGPFICVNTRQLKSFVGRCKSSINGSLQQLGYMAVRTKSKARSCVLACMPILSSDSNLLRQWTVRGASENALFCFVSNFQPNPMPILQPDDLNEDKKNTPVIKIQSTAALSEMHKPQPQPTPPAKLLANNFNISKQDYSKAQQAIQNIILSVLSNSAHQNKVNPVQNLPEPEISINSNSFTVPDIFSSTIPEMSSSFSVDYLTKFNENDWDNDVVKDYDNDFYMTTHKTVARSQSAFFSRNDDWAGFEDNTLFF